MERSGQAGVRALLVLLVCAVLVLPPGPAAVAGGQGWAWPLRPVPVVARHAVLPAQPWAPGHRGVDLAGAPGALVLAPADGVVTFAGRVVDRGVVTIAHAGGLRSSLEPVEPLLAPGQQVRRGDPVAALAGERGHCPARPCLHWGVRRGQVYLDPLSLLRPPEPPVLLPLWTDARALT